MSVTSEGMYQGERRIAVPVEAIDWGSFTLADDPVFSEVMKNPELCRRAIELALQTPVDRVEYRHRQHGVSPSPTIPGIRLDVFAGDGTGRVFDVEMQKTNAGHLPQRARYYHAGIGFELVESARLHAVEQGRRFTWSARYAALGEAYVIFVCLFDPFGRDRQRYAFRSLCVDDPTIELGDGVNVIMLNATHVSTGAQTPLDNFLAYLCGRYDGDDDYVRALDEEVRLVTARADWRASTMHWMEHLEIAEARGEERGMERGADSLTGRLSDLKARMRAAGREAELVEAIGDAALQDRLMREFGV